MLPTLAENGGTMKRIQECLAALLVTLLLPAVCFAGSGNRAGTNGASELLIPIGARDIAMGGASASTSFGIVNRFV